MKFMIAFAALVAVAQAQYLHDSAAVVQGAKAVLEGPSGTLAADTGAIVRNGPLGGYIGSPLLSRSIIDARGLYDPIEHTGQYNHLHTLPGLYNPAVDHGFYGARNFFY